MELRLIRRIVGFLLVFAAMPALASSVGVRFENRWFYSALHPWIAGQWTKLTNVVDIASRHGYNGLLLESRYENSRVWDASCRRGAKALADYCAQRGVEVIPLSWGVGYNALQGVDPNLAEGLPVADLPYVVSADGRTAAMENRVADVLKNPDFEDVRPSGAKGASIPSGWEVLDKPGHCIRTDETTAHSGRRSLRIDRLPEAPHPGQVRIKQRLTLGKNRQYKMNLWFKADELNPNSCLLMQGYAVKGDVGAAGLYTRNVFPDFTRPHYPVTRDWTEISQPIFPDGDGTLDLWIGTWGGKSGTAWVDDITIRETGLPGVIRAPGCPFVVKGAKTGCVYEEGRDYAPVPGLGRGASGGDGESVRLTILPGGRIRPNERLLVSGYGVLSMGDCKQVGSCMSNPRLYELFEENIRDLVATFGTKTWFIACDEVRQAGTCAKCAAYLEGGGTLGELLAASLSKMRAIILKHQPGSRIVIWPDMFSPYMNATRPFHLNPAPFGTKGVGRLPKDIIMADWNRRRLKDDMGYFTGRGFKAIGALYYDEKDLSSTAKNLRICRENPDCIGAIFTTWLNDYRLLADFGDLMLKDE